MERDVRIAHNGREDEIRLRLADLVEDGREFGTAERNIVFAHHFAAGNTDAAIQVYRSAFRPSDVLEAPYVMLGVNAVCAETHEDAERLALPGHLAFLRLRQGKPGLYPSPEEAEAYNFTPFEREAIRGWTASHVIGDPDEVKAGLDDLVARTGADELMLTTMLHSTDDRIRSYELVADAMALERLAA